MKIISHRGKYSKSSTENDISTIIKADKLAPSMIEIDVQQNNTGKVVILHNSIEKYSNKQQSELPLLEDLLKNQLQSKLLIEIKQPHIASNVLKLVKAQTNVAFTSFSLQDAVYIKKNSKHESFIMQRIHPFGLFRKCLDSGLDGIGVNKNWLILMPFIYFKCKSNNKLLIIYTINNSHLAKITKKLFKDIYICTDETKKFVNY